jgi:sporulation protein YlmC with PRC-barrel domain
LQRIFLQKEQEMEEKLQFQKNAKVVDVHGESIGQLARVVLKPEDLTVTDIVIHTGSMFNKQEKVVPIELVDTTNKDQIILRGEAKDLKDLSSFEEEHLVETDKKDIEPPVSTEFTTATLYGYALAAPIPPDETEEKYVTKKEQNIPEGAVAMKQGAKIISAEGEHVGDLERVLAETPTEHITHLLISSGIVTKEKKLIPITWVKEIGENEVQLRVTKNSVEELAGISTTG